MDVDNWFRHLETLGFTILHNSHVKISQGADYFCLAGVDDWSVNMLDSSL